MQDCTIRITDEAVSYHFVDVSKMVEGSHLMTWSHLMTVAIYFAPKGALGECGGGFFPDMNVGAINISPLTGFWEMEKV